jgi:hypothetical protein
MNNYFDTPQPQIKEQEYLHTAIAGAVLPFIQSLITGLLLGLIVLVVTLWKGFNDWLVYSLLTWLIVTALTWLTLQRHWWSLTAIERFTGWDINHDGIIGDDPQPASRHSVLVDVSQKNAGGFDRIDTARLPFSEDNITALAVGLLAGRPFTEREWTGAGRPLSVGQFREARTEMQKRGLIEQVNPKAPQQGYKLTYAGGAVMRHFASDTPSIKQGR